MPTRGDFAFWAAYGAASRRRLAEEIVGSLMVNGQGEMADRLVLMRRGLPGQPERDLGGWSCSAAIDAVEKCLRGFGR